LGGTGLFRLDSFHASDLAANFTHPTGAFLLSGGPLEAQVELLLA
jgi:hypothetical protein